MNSIGHNSGDRTDDVQRRYEQTIIAISNWARNHRLEEALSRQQLGGLSGLDRLIMLRNAALDNMRQFYVTNPQADAAAGVLMLICLMSDNSDGCCSLSVSRMAEFFNRDRRNVGKALARLEEQGLIKVKRREGKNSLVWPVINPIYAEHRVPTTWVLDSYAPTARHVAPATQQSQASEPAIQLSQVVNFSAQSEAANGACDTGVASEAEVDLRYCYPRPAMPPSQNNTNHTAKEVSIDSEGGLGETAPSPSARAEDGQADLERLTREANDRLASALQDDGPEAIELEPVVGEIIEPGLGKGRASQSGATQKPRTRSKAKITFEELPDDYWSQEDFAYGVEQGLTPEQVRAQFLNFRDHYVSKGAKFVSGIGWRLSWQKWCRTGVAWNRPSGGAAGVRRGRANLDDLADQAFN